VDRVQLARAAGRGAGRQRQPGVWVSTAEVASAGGAGVCAPVTLPPPGNPLLGSPDSV
jgi:hypothetical protein